MNDAAYVTVTLYGHVLLTYYVSCPCPWSQTIQPPFCQWSQLPSEIEQRHKFILCFFSPHRDIFSEGVERGERYFTDIKKIK